MAGVLEQLRPLWQRLEQERGLPTGYLDRSAFIESRYNPSAKNPNSSAGGMFQFIDGTARQYGLSNKFDPFAASDAAARLASDNAAYLRKNLGRDPTAGELYLAHQQGPAGAVKLLSGGDADASSVVGSAEAGLNGGRGLSANAMARKWTSKFDDIGGTSRATTSQPEGQTEMAGAADLPAPDAVQAGGASQFAIPGETPFAGKEAAGGMDWDTLMMGMALLANAIPNGQAAKDMGSIMAPFMQNASRKEDRNYQRGRDAKTDARYERSETRQAAADAQNQANWQAQFGLSKAQSDRQAAAEARADAKPLIQKFEDPAGNPIYKQFDVTTRQWIPLSDGSGPPQPGPPSAPAAAVTAGSPAMDGLPSAPLPQASAPPQGFQMQPPPPGVNREQWYKEQTTRAAKDAAGPQSEEITSLRKEIQALPSYKNLSQAAPIYNGMLDAAGRNSKAADLNLVYGLGKIMDPTSVVREGEMIMVKNSAGLSEQVLGAINALNGGAALTPETREAIMREAHGRVKAYEQQYQQDTRQYAGIVERRRMDPRDVIADFGQFNAWQRPQGATPAAPVSAPPTATPGAKPADGAERRVINGRTAVRSGKSWFWED